MSKEDEVMQFLTDRVFDPILNSSVASDSLKQGVRLTTIRMRRLNAVGMVSYYWSAITGTEKSTAFARQMRDEGFTRFEDIVEELAHGLLTNGWKNEVSTGCACQTWKVTGRLSLVREGNAMTGAGGR